MVGYSYSECHAVSDCFQQDVIGQQSHSESSTIGSSFVVGAALKSGDFELLAKRASRSLFTVPPKIDDKLSSELFP